MAAGLGTRMRSETPKHLHPLLGRRLVDWVVDAARALDPQPLVVVTSPETKDAFDGNLEVAIQEEARGTGDAVAAARAALERIPVHAAQNLTLLDRSGAYLTAYVGPGRPPRFRDIAATTASACDAAAIHDTCRIASRCRCPHSR